MRLKRAIERYVAVKHSMGIIFKMGERLLQSLPEQTGNVPIRSITKRQVRDLLDGAKTSDMTWLVKFRSLKAFFEYWRARGEIRELPMPRLRAVVRVRRFVPYVYSVSEIRQLLYGIRFKRVGRPREIDPLTLRTILLFLYGTGARIAETLALKHGDVDFENGTAIFHRIANRTRTIPLGKSLRRWLQEYRESSNQIVHGETPFFARNDGKGISPIALDRHFHSLRRKLGISRRHGIGDSPKIRDLRHTFAVDCLRSWLRKGKDLRSMLPILAAYLGHVSLSSTEVYLPVTPERFSPLISKLSPELKLKSLDLSCDDWMKSIPTGIALLGILSYVHERTENFRGHKTSLIKISPLPRSEVGCSPKQPDQSR